MARNIAVIPVRGGSTRVKKKNFIDFFGKPMFVHTYDAAVESGVFDDVVISTDSDEALEICRQRSIPVPFVRPAELGGDTVSLNDVLIHALEEMKKKGKSYDNLCLLWATSPLRNAEDIRKAYKMLEGKKEADAVIGTTDCFHYYPAHINDEKGFIKPLVIFENMTSVRGQDLAPTFVDNGSLAWVRVPALIKEKTWMPKKSVGYYMPRQRSVDVDTPEDLELLSFYFRKYARPAAMSPAFLQPDNFIKVFFDTEFTRGGQNTTLISIGFVSEKGDELYIELNDYDKEQVTPWLEENILNLLDGNAVSTSEATKKIESWFEEIAGGKKVQMVSSGKQIDDILLYNMWSRVEAGSRLRSWDKKLPYHIEHRAHLDIDTLFSLHGLDPTLDRYEFAGLKTPNKRHKAIDDARVIRACWMKMQHMGWVN